MNIYSLSVLLFSFGVLLIAFLGFAKRHDLIATRFAFFSLSVCSWGIFWAAWTSVDWGEPEILILMQMAHLFAFFIPVTWVHFVCEFTMDKPSNKYFLQVSYLVAIGLSLFAFNPLFISGSHPLKEVKYFPSPGPIYHIFSAFFTFLVPYAFFKLLKAYRKYSGNLKLQLKYLIMGTAVGFTAGGSTFLLVYDFKIPLAMVCIMPLYPFLVGNALVRYGLFDVQEIADAFQREKMAVLGTMAASLNHEIKNPLYVVRGKAECYLDALERGKYTCYEDIHEASKATVNPILNHVIRALDIIQKFTDFARPFNAKGSKETIVLSEVFQDVRELVSSEFQRSEVQLVHNLTNGVSVVANRRHVEEILSNLVINACHAIEIGQMSKVKSQNSLSSPNGLIGDPDSRQSHSGMTKLENTTTPGLGYVTVNAHKANGKVIVEVSDTGPGIPKENLARVFEPFFTTKGPKGSGLGLYITKQLVERNGGKIKVNSKLGQGTTFRLELAAK